MAIVIKSSRITGIHRTKISSHEEVTLLVERDDSVQHIDPQCMKVMFPMFVEHHLRDEIVWPKNPAHKRFQDQRVRDCIGKKVGNVPANLAGLFRRILASNKVSKITSHSMGMKPQPSRRPPTKSKFRKGRGGEKDRRGGGLVLACSYQLHLSDEKYRSSVLNEVGVFIEGDDGDEELDI